LTETKPWKCEDCGHPLGIIEYTNGVPTLRLNGIITIVGAAELMCDCGKIMVWHPNAAALSQLFRDRKIRQAAIRAKLEELDRAIRG